MSHKAINQLCEFAKMIQLMKKKLCRPFIKSFWSVLDLRMISKKGKRVSKSPEFVRNLENTLGLALVMVTLVI